jgi:molecular chaperone GrpE
VGDQPEPDERLDSEAAQTAPEAPGPDESSASGTVTLAAAIVVPQETGAREQLEQKVRLAEARLAEVLAAYRQLKAGEDAFRERTARSLEKRFEGRHERLLLKFIDVLDNFDRALEATEQTYAGQPLIEGLILVRVQLLQTLQQEGLERIPVLGLPFDPHVSEAMSTEAVDDPERHGVVVKELQRGYRIKDRLARPSRVVVGQYAEKVVEGAESATPSPVAQQSQRDEGEPAGEESPGLVAYDYPAPLKPIEPEDHEAEEEASTASAPKLTPVDDDGPTLEEIIARAEAQQALFGEAFEKEAADEEPEDGGAKV